MIDLIGWDIGGAHLKAAAMAGDRLIAVCQKPSPLWQGLSHFHGAAVEILRHWELTPDCHHAVTMTGELVDLFSDREAGVRALITAMTEHAPAPQTISLFAGIEGFLAPEAILPRQLASIASANWLATALFAGQRCRDAILVDIGSSTADIFPLAGGQIVNRGYTDYERMSYDELLYTGVVRTPLMALANRCFFRGEWVGLMAEHFATTADVYRLLGDLPEYADQLPAADGGEKSLLGSARRLARLLGCDVAAAELADWVQVARFFREQQLGLLTQGLLRNLSRNPENADIPFIGAGVGRFLVRQLASRLGHAYLDFNVLAPTPELQAEHDSADCAAAVAIAQLALQSR